MADYGSPIGGLLQGFNQTYWPAMRQNEILALQKAQDQRAQDLIDFQKRKYAEAEEKDKQAAGLYAGMLGIKPTMTEQRSADEVYRDAEASGDFMGVPTTTEKADPRYEQLLAGGSKAAADLVKQQRETQIAALKARTDAWKEAQAQRLADLKDKQIAAMLVNGDKRMAQALALLAAKQQGQREMVDYKEDKKRGEPLSPEAAAKVGMVNQGYTLVDEVRNKIFDENGNLNSGYLAQSHIPWSEAAKTRQQMKASIEAALRIASGAAVPESEVNRYSDMYIPSWYDKPDVARDKLDRLQGFYRDTLKRSKTGGMPLAFDGEQQAAVPGARVRTFNPQTGRLE